jgi:RND family efflux transporter MFP subunit
MVDQQEMFRIAGDNSLEVSARISETDVTSLHVGQAATFHLADGGAVTGTLSRTPASIDERTRTGEALFDLPTNTVVRAGMHLSGEIELAPRQALAVSQDALRYESGRAYLFVLGADNRVHKTYVGLGARDGDFVEVVSGLSAGAHVVGAGSAFLQDGDAVRAAPGQQSSDAEQLRGRTG